jgi:hypothetical protein
VTNVTFFGGEVTCNLNSQASSSILEEDKIALRPEGKRAER